MDVREELATDWETLAKAGMIRTCINGHSIGKGNLNLGIDDYGHWYCKLCKELR